MLFMLTHVDYAIIISNNSTELNPELSFQASLIFNDFVDCSFIMLHIAYNSLWKCSINISMLPLIDRYPLQSIYNLVYLAYFTFIFFGLMHVQSKIARQCVTVGIQTFLTMYYKSRVVRLPS